jgi:hypothetical protein
MPLTKRSGGGLEAIVCGSVLVGALTLESERVPPPGLDRR